MERPILQKVTHAEAFNKVCKVLNKVHNVQQSNSDLCVLAVLCAYGTTCKKLMTQMPPRLKYGANVVIPIEQKMPSLSMAASTNMTFCRTLEDGVRS